MRVTPARLLCVLLLCLLGPAAAVADDATVQTGLRLEAVDIHIVDTYGRAWYAPADSVWLGIRLGGGENKSESLAGYTSLSAQGLQYDVDSDRYVQYHLEDGTAHTQFIVFEDASKNPVNYELTLFEKTSDGGKRQIALSNNLWQAGMGQGGTMKARARRPLITVEKVALASFVAITLVVGYLLFGRLLFRRMLFSKRMDVGSAVTWSNILVLLFLLLAIAVSAFLYIYPYVLWGNPYSVYAVTGCGYIAFLFLVYGIGCLATRRA